MVHELLFTRFSVAPRMVVYDNACNLAVHCIMREPAFYGSTQFIVDRFHYKSHRHCPHVYDAEYYPSLDRSNT